MTSQWVIPGWPEADEHLSCWLQERVHDTQDSRGVGEMLKRVHGNDNVRKLLRRRYEETSILNTRTERLLSGCLENVLTDINTDHPLGPFSAISTASAPSPQPKSMTTFPAILLKNLSPIRTGSFDLPS